MSQKIGHKNFYVLEKILRTQSCRRKFIKNLLSEKLEENI